MAFYRSKNRVALGNYGQTLLDSLDPFNQSRPGIAGMQQTEHAYNQVRKISGRWDPSLSYVENIVAGRKPPLPGVGRPGRPVRAPGTPLPLGVSMREQPVPNPFGANQFNWQTKFNQGVADPEFEGKPYLGGFPDDTMLQGTAAIPYAGDNLSMRYWNTQTQRKPVFAPPKYRDGQQATYGAKLSPGQVQEWQRFFQMAGFATGPAGFWTEAEMKAMGSFMAMANSVAGMTVEKLRTQVLNDPALSTPGTLAQLLGQSDGGGGTGEPLGPYTETTTNRQVTEFSLDQGMLLIRDQLAREIGRAPTQSEIGRYVKGLNAAFRADPSILTTVVTVDEAGNKTTETTEDPTGVDPQAQAMDFAESASPEERESYQANRYMDALMRELGM